MSAHATATVAGDREEAAALRNVFGGGVPVSSLKGHLGHTLGASGAIELAAVCEMGAPRRGGADAESGAGRRGVAPDWICPSRRMKSGSALLRSAHRVRRSERGADR